MSLISPNQIGNLSEVSVLSAYFKAGFSVSIPFGGHARYDLIVDTGCQLLKIQVKTGRLRDGCILFRAFRNSGPNGRGLTYDVGDYDYLVIYCCDLDRIFAMPFVDYLQQGRLRYENTKNNQIEKIRWANDHTFEQHIEKLKSEVELRGLEPLAS